MEYYTALSSKISLPTRYLYCILVGASVGAGSLILTGALFETASSAKQYNYISLKRPNLPILGNAYYLPIRPFINGGIENGQYMGSLAELME